MNANERRMLDPFEKRTATEVYEHFMATIKGRIVLRLGRQWFFEGILMKWLGRKATERAIEEVS